MRKAFIVMIVVILLLGVSGCESLRASQEELSLIDATNACNIAVAINAYNDFNLNNDRLPDGITLEDAKKAVGVGFWPNGLSDEEEKRAWKLVVYNYGQADITPAAREALREAREALQVSATPHNALREYNIENAGNIAIAINTYNYLNPDSELPDGITLEDAKEELIGEQLWPMMISDEEARTAWELIVYKDGIAVVMLSAEAAMRASASTDEKKSAPENAYDIVITINAYTALSPNASPLPDDITLEEAKDIIGKWLWPIGLSEEDERAAWELIEIKDGVAKLKPEAEEALKVIQASEAETEQAVDETTLTYANACNIATAINAYNALNPNSVLPDGVSIEEAKEVLEEDGLWPQGLPDEQASEAWKLIVYKDGIAELK